MRWLPVVAILILETIYIVFARASLKRSGRRLLLPIPIGLILGFLMWLLTFSALGFAQGRGMVRTLAWSAGGSVVMVVFWAWQLRRKKLNRLKRTELRTDLKEPGLGQVSEARRHKSAALRWRLPKSSSYIESDQLK